MTTIARPLKPQYFHILLALSRRQLHGYAIQRAVLEQTDEQVRLWPAMLYRSLNKLEAGGLIRLAEPPRDEPEDERRTYYGITPEGLTRLKEEAETLARWAADARRAT